MREHTILLLLGAFVVVLSSETSRGFCAVFFFFLLRNALHSQASVPFFFFLNVSCIILKLMIGIEQIMRIN